MRSILIKIPAAQDEAPKAPSAGHRVTAALTAHIDRKMMPYTKAPQKNGNRSVEATIHQRRLLFALVRQGDERLPKRLLFAGKLEGGEDPPAAGQPAQHYYWQKSPRGDFKASGALRGPMSSNRRTFGVDRLVAGQMMRRAKRECRGTQGSCWGRRG